MTLNSIATRKSSNDNGRHQMQDSRFIGHTYDTLTEQHNCFPPWHQLQYIVKIIHSWTVISSVISHVKTLRTVSHDTVQQFMHVLIAQGLSMALEFYKLSEKVSQFRTSMKGLHPPRAERSWCGLNWNFTCKTAFNHCSYLYATMQYKTAYAVFNRIHKRHFDHLLHHN